VEYTKFSALIAIESIPAKLAGHFITAIKNITVISKMEITDRTSQAFAGQ
jgi:hypothetical protein